MNCRIFRSDRKSETYLYVVADLDFKDLPEELRTAFGDPGLVMTLELTPVSKLARVDVKKVLKCLEKGGLSHRKVYDCPNWKTWWMIQTRTGRKLMLNGMVES